VLRQTAQRLRNSVRPYDAVGRYGGEEFLIVLPGCDSQSALSLAERLRQCVAANRIDAEGTEVPITLSLGVAVSSGEANADAVELLRAADAALYDAKHAGRNRIRLGIRTDRAHDELHRMAHLSS
jgi:diguanylate cyclase (GGDEF)-like protein